MAVALLLGALSATGFAPLHLWPVALLCLAGLTALVAGARTVRGAVAIGYGFGVGQFTLGLNWIAHAFTFQDAMPHWLGYPAVFLLSLYLAVYPAAATALVALTGTRRRPLALVLTLAGSWTATEYLRSTLFTGFAWNPQGVIWLDTGVEQAARGIGTYGLTALAVLSGGALWLLAKGRWRQGAVLVALPIVLAAVGLGTLPAPKPGTVPITIAQPNIGQSEKYDPQAEALHFRTLARLTRASGDTAGRLVLWPEAALPAYLELEPEWRRAIARLLEPEDLLLLGGDKLYLRKGAGTVDTGTVIGANNSAWVLTPDARLIGRYDKAHLVPYGEYLPMRPWLSMIGLSRLVPGDIDFWPGPGPRTLDLPATPHRPALKAGVQICYEIIFSGQVVDATHRPDFLYNPSNDAWFGDWGPPQHLAQARLRAVEEAMPVIRATPTGISAVVDARGRVIASLPLGRPGAIHALLPPAAPPTPFSRLGNVVPLALAALLIISGVALTRRTR